MNDEDYAKTTDKLFINSQENILDMNDDRSYDRGASKDYTNTLG